MLAPSPCPRRAPRPGALALGVLLALGAGAAPAAASVDPHRAWFVLETENFSVYTYDGGEALARQVAAYAEEAWETLNPILGWTPRSRVHVIVADEVDSANGFAMVLPYNRFTVWAFPPQADSDLAVYASWLKLLVFHEYTHVVHLDRSSGAPEVVNTLFGRLIKPNQALPRWLTEGIAVWIESTRTGGGRVGASRFEMYARASALAGRLPSLGDLTGFPLEQPRGAAWYLYGGYLIDHIARAAGPESVRDFIAGYGHRILPFAVNHTLRRATGKGFDVWYAELLDDLRARAQAVAARVEAAGRVEGEQLTTGGELKLHPRFSPDGRWLAWVRGDGHSPTDLVLAPAADPAAATRLIRCEGGCGELAFSRDGASLYYTTGRFYRNVNFYGAIGRVPVAPPLGRRDVEIVAGTRRGHHPTVSADGRRLWFVATAWGETWLQAVDPVTGDVLDRIDPPAGGRIDHPIAHPDGRSLFVSMHHEGNRDLYRVDLADRVERAGARFERLTEGAALELDLVLSPDGRWLVYSSDADGVYDIYARELASGQTRRLTRVLTGAFDPAISPDGQWLIYSGWTVEGFELYRLPFAPEAAPTVDDPDPQPLRPAEPARPVEVARRPYQALPLMLPRSWLPTWSLGSDGLSRLGVSLEGRDPTGRYDAIVSAEWDFEREDISAFARATVTPGYPSLSLSLGRYTWDRHSFVGDRVEDYREEVFFSTAAVSLSLPDVFTGLTVGTSFTVDLARELRGAERHPTPDQSSPFVPREGLATSMNLFWSLSDLRSFIFSVSPQIGVSAFMNLRLRHPLIGGARSTYTLTWVGRAYLPMPFDSHALGFRLEGGASGGDVDTRSTFALGGVPSQDLLTDLLNQTTAGAVWLRGFEPGAFRGTSFHLLTTEYRLPLLRVRRGLDSLPFFAEDLSLAVFSDAAVLSDAPLTASGFDALRVGLGVELRTRVDLFYGLLIDLRLGYARGLGPDGVDQFYLLMAPPP